jgi:hypothetical protein
MNHNNDESQFWEILTREHLVDLSQFHKPRFFDEVPFLARESDMAFLSDYPSEQANTMVLRFALKFLKSVVSYEEHLTAYFAAVTVWRLSESDPFTPICSFGPARFIGRRKRSY